MIVTNISLSKIVPNENQPRKYFDEGKLGTLRSSIKKYGIKQPLTVELRKDGKYYLLNGERRYRAAKDLELKEVPVIIEQEMSEIERTIEMFHLQEQHEGWTPTEKAVAVSNLASAMGVGIAEMGRVLGIPQSTVSDYIAFGKIIDRASFQRYNIPLSMAGRINSIMSTARRVSEDAKIDFDRNTAKKIEQSIYNRVRNGEAMLGRGQRFFTRIKDSFVQDPKAIEKFIDDEKMTVDKMFNETNASGAYYLRNARSNAAFLKSNIIAFQKEKSVKVSQDVIAELKITQRQLNDFIKQYED